MFLRAVNVGGKNKVPMKELLGALENSGCKGVTSYIQSGNLVLDSSLGRDRLGGLVQSIILKAFSVETVPIVISASQLSELVTNNPFLEGRNARTHDTKEIPEIESLYVTIPSGQVKAESITELDPEKYIPDQFHIGLHGIYIKCSRSYSDTKLNNQFWEKKCGLPATTRNWKTVLKMEELVNAN